MPRALERELYKELQTVPSARARPPGINAPAQGVSMRELPYLFDEPGGECERSLIHPPNAHPASEGSSEGERICTMQRYFSIQQCTNTNGEKGGEN